MTYDGADRSAPQATVRERPVALRSPGGLKPGRPIGVRPNVLPLEHALMFPWPGWSIARGALASALALAALVEPASACDPVWLPSIRLPGTARMVVQFASDTVADLPRPTYAVSRAAAFKAMAGFRRRAPYGQRASVLSVGAQSAWQAQPGTPIILVPWEFSSDCEPMPFTQSARWADALVPSAVTAWLRPRAGWIGGVPTLDVEKAGIEPRWRDQDARWPHDRGNLMSAAEYLALVETLPTPAQLERDPAGVRRRIESWVMRHRALAEKEPGRTILANLRRQASR